MPKKYDFTKFLARKYLEEYYSSLEKSEKRLLNFYDFAYKKAKGRTLLEIGGGPTLYQLISASKVVKEIYFTDYLAENLSELAQFKKKQPGAFNWNRFFAYVAKLEKGDKQALEDRLRKKLKKILKLDLNSDSPLPFKKKFDLVSMNFCAESITDNEQLFKLYLKRSFSYLKKDGYFVGAFLRKANYYTIGRRRFPAYYLDEESLKKTLHKHGLKILKMDSIIFRDPENKGNIAVLAIKL